MIFFVLLGCGLLLIPPLVVSSLSMSVLLLLIILTAGLFVRYNIFAAYILFIFIYPLLPSQEFESLSFDYLEFVFLSFAFWWAVAKISRKETGLPSHSLNTLLTLFITGCFLSALLALLEHHYLFSEIFFRMIRDNLNIFSSAANPQLEPLRSLLYFLEGILFFFITLDVVNNTQKFEKTGSAIIYASGLVAVIGILQYFLRYGLVSFWVQDNPNLVRINATFSDPNSFGTYLSVVLCFGVFAFISDFPAHGKRYSLIIGTLLIPLIFTASRAALGAVIGSLLILPTIFRLRNHDISSQIRGILRPIVRYGLYVLLFVLAATIVAAALIDERNPKSTSFARILLFTLNPRVALNVIMKGRLDMWGAALRMFLEAPVFGIGLGTFGSRILAAPYSLMKPENAHNYFLQILAEGGIVVFGLFALLIFQIFRIGIRRIQSGNRKETLLTFGLFSGLVAFLLTSLTGHPLLLLKLQLLFWSFVAMLTFGAVALVRRRFRLGVGIATFLALIIGVFMILRSRNIFAYEYGYYSWEKDETQEPFRWTSAEAISLLKVRGNILQFQIRQLNPDLVQQPYQVKIFLDDKLADTIALSDTNWKDCKYFLPFVKQQELVKLRIVPEGTFVPVRFGTDTRRLGIEVGRFSWHCSLPEDPIGVYGQEDDSGFKYYWTGGQASFPIHQGVSKISFHVLPNLSALTSPVTVAVFWNDRPLRKLVLTRLQWSQVDLQLPDSPPGVLTVQVSPTINPRRSGQSNDTRELGIRIRWPFEITPATSVVSSGETILDHPSVYAISNIGNQPILLKAYSYEPKSKDFGVLHDGNWLFHQPEFFKSIQPSENWISLFRSGPENGVTPLLENRLVMPSQLSSGYWLLRMIAKGDINTSELPMARVAIDDRELARQPILPGEWNDYYLNVEVPVKGKQILIELVNETPNKHLFIREVLASRKQSEAILPDLGWVISDGKLLVAEKMDRDSLLGPLNFCYRIPN